MRPLSSKKFLFYKTPPVGFVSLAVIGGLTLLGAGHSAQAQLSGFTPADYTLNGGGGGGDSTTKATINSGVLTLTDNGSSEAVSAFNNTAQSVVNGFTASFTYTDATVNTNTGAVGGGANGATFCLQSSPQGTAVVGGRGAGLGYGHDDSNDAGRINYVADSFALEINIFTGNSQTAGIAFNTAGAAGTLAGTTFTQGPNGVNVGSGDPILFNLSYNGTMLTATLTDSDTGAVDTFTDNVNIASFTGNEAFVGFTGGSGGESALQEISNFAFTPTVVPEPSTWAMLVGGIALLGAAKLRARRTV